MRRRLRPDNRTFLQLLFAVQDRGTLPLVCAEGFRGSDALALAMDAYAGRLNRTELATLTKWADEAIAARDRKIELMKAGAS